MIDDWEIRWLNPYWIYSKSRIGTELNKHGEEVSYGTNWFDTKEEAEQAIKLWREKNMKNYMQINGKKIEISQETADNLEKEFSPKTYKVGDKFQSTLCSDIGLLISAGTKVGMLNVIHSYVYNGIGSESFKAVKNRQKITEDELIMIAGSGWELIDAQ